MTGWLLALALIPGAESGGKPPAAASEQGKPAILRDVGYDQRLGERLPLDIELRDETGRKVRLGDYFGRRPVVLSLVYYQCPMLCTLTLSGLTSALRALSFEPGREFEIVTVSFDHREGPELAAAKKKAYLDVYKRPGAEASWHFLTGDQVALASLTRAVGFRYTWDEATKQFAHPAGILVATPDGTIARYLYGVEYAPRDLRFALVESAAGRIGTPVDTLLLYCYQYDPHAGRYSAAILGWVRVAGGLTVLALAGFMALMLWRERARARAVPQPKERQAG